MDYHGSLAADPLAALPAAEIEAAEIARLARLMIQIFPRQLRSLATQDGITIALDFNDDPYGGVAGYGYGYVDAYENGRFGTVPASDAAIASLPKKTRASGGGRGKAARAEECAVCLEVFELGAALRTMPCAHEFHDGCIVDWLRVSRTCPLCRFKLPAAEYDSEDSEYEYEDEDGATEQDARRR